MSSESILFHWSSLSSFAVVLCLLVSLDTVMLGTHAYASIASCLMITGALACLQFALIETGPKMRVFTCVSLGQVWTWYGLHLVFEYCTGHLVMAAGLMALTAYVYYSQAADMRICMVKLLVGNTLFVCIAEEFLQCGSSTVLAAHAELLPIVVVLCCIFKPRSSDISSLKLLLDRIHCGIAIMQNDHVVYANQFLAALSKDPSLEAIDAHLQASPVLSKAIASFLVKSQPWAYISAAFLENRLFDWDICRINYHSSPAMALICRESAASPGFKTRIIRSVTHNIKTPLNCIMHMSEELISAAEMPTGGGQKCEIIRSYCHFMSFLVNDMVDYSDLASGRELILRKSRVNLKELLTKCNEMLTLFAEAKKLALQISFDPNLQTYIFTDASRLTQLVLNLLSNAIKYTYHGSVKLIALQKSTKKVKIIVEDSGIGIEPARLRNLVNSDKSLPTSGIGLYLANALAWELGHEELQISSQSGAGSAFSFTVVAKESPSGDMTPGLQPESPMLDVGGGEVHQVAPVFYTSKFMQRMEHGADILLVDDYPFNRMIVRTVLERENLRVDEAENGLIAIQMIQEKAGVSQHYRLIIMDIDMPVLDGIRTTERLRAMQLEDPSLALPPILGHSAFTSEADIERFLAVGMQAFIPKPFIKDLAMSVIWRYMQPA